METGLDLEFVIYSQDGFDLGSGQYTGSTASEIAWLRAGVAILACTNSQTREFIPISPRIFIPNTSEQVPGDKVRP